MLVCVAIGLWSPWLMWNVDISDIFNVEKPNVISGLQVYSLLGEVEVFVDGESQGKVTPEDSPLIVDAIQPGEKSVRIERVSEVTDAYWAFEKVITFEESIDVVISYVLGPEKEFSEGHVITVTEKTDEDYNLLVNTNIEGTAISLDEIQSQVPATQFTQNIALDKQHKIKIFKPGFEEIEFTILPESQDDRDQFANKIINVDVQLLYQPVQVE